MPIYLSSVSSGSNSSLASTSTSTFSTAKSAPTQQQPPALPPKPKSLSPLTRQSENQHSSSGSSAGRTALTSTSSYVVPPLLPKREFINSKSSRSSSSTFSNNTIKTTNPTTTKSNALLSPTLTSSASSLFLLGKGWGKKGKERLQEGWNVSKRNSVSIVNLAAASVGNSSSNLRNNSNGNSNGAGISSELTGGIRLPCTILGVRVPNKTGQCFGIPLSVAVERTRIKMISNGSSSSNNSDRRGLNMDEVKGNEARNWLPCIAYRCIEYLELWTEKGEEGLYRVPGRSHQVAQLRALFDAGEDIDLRDMHPADLDPHAVASVFKAWLREIPESLLSPALETKIDNLVTESTGFSATSTQYLGHHSPDSSKMVNGRAPPEMLESLGDIFSLEMKAEQFYLLRAICFHLARCEMRQEKTKMTLANLRLILSPTLKLSPTFLLILITERSIFFGKPNESSRQRETELGFNLIATPTSATSSKFPSNRSSTSTRILPPPFLQPLTGDINLEHHRRNNSSPMTNHNNSSPPHIWLKIDESPLESSSKSVNSNSASTTPTTRTPIADRYVSPLLSSSSTFSDNLNYFDPISSSSSSMITVEKSNGGTSILDRSVSRGNRSLVGGSSSTASSFINRDIRNLSSAAPPSLPAPSSSSLTSKGTQNAFVPTHYSRLSDVSNHSASASSLPYHSHSRTHSHSRSLSNTTIPLSNAQGSSILSPHRYSQESFMSKNGGGFEYQSNSNEQLKDGEFLRRFSRPVPSVSLPEGFGGVSTSSSSGSGLVIGKGEIEEEEDEFGLLSVEERKKFFSREGLVDSTSSPTHTSHTSSSTTPHVSNTYTEASNTSSSSNYIAGPSIVSGSSQRHTLAAPSIMGTGANNLSSSTHSEIATGTRSDHVGAPAISDTGFSESVENGSGALSTRM